MSDLTSMTNIGKELARKLTVVGIGSSDELIAAGSKQAFFQLKERYPHVCLVHLYALEGAIRQTEFNRLPEETKQDLKAFSDFLKRR